MNCLLCDCWIPPESDGGILVKARGLVPLCYGCHGSIAVMERGVRMETFPIFAGEVRKHELAEGKL